MAGQDYYRILDVPENADTQQIKTAYRRLALQYHPDKNEDNVEAAQKMQQINEAYAVLADPEKRREYDGLRQVHGASGAQEQFRRTWSEQELFKDSDIREVFDGFAKSFGFRGFDDLSKELFLGKSNIFEFSRPGMHVKGAFFFGSFQLDKGAVKRMLPRLLGKVAGLIGRSLSLENIPLKPTDLHDTIVIDPELARTGGPYAYYHKWQDKKLIVMIPENTRHGRQIRLAGMGEKEAAGTAAGDLYIRVETRDSLTSKLKKMLPF